MRWLATPRRTRRGRSCSAKNARSSSPRATGSTTSPSRRMPGRRSATAPRVTVIEPLTCTSAAAMWLGSRSRPTATSAFTRFFLNTVPLSAGVEARLSRRSASRQLAPGVLDDADGSEALDRREAVRVVVQVELALPEQQLARPVDEDAAVEVDVA